MTGAEILKKRDRMRSKQDPYKLRWENIARMFDPTSYGVQTPASPGESITREMFDSTGQDASQILANFLASEILRPNLIHVVPSHPAAKEDDAAKEFCEEIGDIAMKRVAQDNFYTEGAIALKQLVTFGTASLFMGPKIKAVNEQSYGFQGIRFRADKIGRYYIERDGNGVVTTEYIDFKLSADAANGMFPKAPDNCRFKAALKDRPEETFDFIHACYPRPKGERGYGNKGFSWASCYVEEASREKVEESGFPYFPYAVPVWDCVPGEDYGRGPAEIAYNHMKSKNAARTMNLEAWAMKIRPPIFTAHDSAINILRVRPAGNTVVNTHGRDIRQTVMPWDAGGDLQWNESMDGQIRNEIWSMFYIDTIKEIMTSDLKDVNNYTFAKKLEVLYKILGANYARIQRELLQAIFDPLLIHLFMEGQFPKPPDILLETGGSVDIEFENPLARAQQIDETNSLSLAFGDLAPIIDYQLKVNGYAEVLDGYDTDEWRNQVNKNRMVPAKVVRNPDQIAEIRKGRAEGQAQAEQQQQIAGMAEAAGKAAPMLTAIQGGKAA